MKRHKISPEDARAKRLASVRRGGVTGSAGDIGESLGVRFRSSRVAGFKANAGGEIIFIRTPEVWASLFYGDESEGIVEGSTGGPRPISVDSFPGATAGLFRRAASGF